VELARKGDKPVSVLAKDLGISDSCLRNWVHQADTDDNGGTKLTSAEKKVLLRPSAADPVPAENPVHAAQGGMLILVEDSAHVDVFGSSDG
jgi:transposase-like protein